MKSTKKYSFLPISLGIRQQPGVGETDFFYPNTQAKTDKVLRRDDYTCRCCGFRSRRYQRAISAASIRGTSDDYITACLFCELCFNLERAGVIGSNHLIWLPELGQLELNHALRAIYIARQSGHPIAETATRTLDALLARRAEAKKRLGSDDPLLLATVFQEELIDTDRIAVAAKLDGIRLLPLDRFQAGNDNSEDPFSRMVRYWASAEGPYGQLAPSEWEPLFDAITTKAAPLN